MTNENRYWNALRTIASMPMPEQDNMISASMRHVAREALDGQEPTVRYGCHCDLEPGANPDGCVLDEDRAIDCVYAQRLEAEGKKREDCGEWRPVTFERPNAEVTPPAACGRSGEPKANEG